MGLSGPSRHPEQVEDGMGRERGSSLERSGQASLEDSVRPRGERTFQPQKHQPLCVPGMAVLGHSALCASEQPCSSGTERWKPVGLS